MGPTHPRALSVYRFEIVGRRAVGTDRVVEIAFRPRSPLQPGLAGTVAVLPETDALLAVTARPSGAVQFPLVTQFDLTLEQQFASFGQAVAGEPVWLPVDFRLAATARAGNALLRFPGIGFVLEQRFGRVVVSTGCCLESLRHGAWEESLLPRAPYPVPRATRRGL